MAKVSPTDKHNAHTAVQMGFENKPMYHEHRNMNCSMRLVYIVNTVQNVYRTYRCDTHERFVYEYPVSLTSRFADGKLMHTDKERNSTSVSSTD